MKQRVRFIVSALLTILMCGIASAQVTVPVWNGSFEDTNNHNKVYPFTMVGSDPSQNTSTQVTVYLVPLKVVYPSSSCQSGQTVFDPMTLVQNQETAVANLVSSPIFTPISNFPEQGNGSPIQYIDAFQRGNFWSIVETNTNSHLILQNPPNYVSEQTITVNGIADGIALDDPTGQSGGCVGLVTTSWFDGQLSSLVSTLYQQHLIQPTGLAMFVSYDIFYGQYHPAPVGWENRGAGVHSSTLTPDGYGVQTWVSATYNGYDNTVCRDGGQPATCLFQDVDDFSHEVGEWADDPFGDTPAPCGILEVGDPLLPFGTSAYYTYPGTNGFNYHLQDLVFLPYFGADPATSYKDRFTFQGEQVSCGD